MGRGDGSDGVTVVTVSAPASPACPPSPALGRALAEFVVEGVKTTIPIHQQIFNHSAFIEGLVDTTFIERNWKLQPLTTRSRDNLPNPKTARNNPYVPTNSPALSDLFDTFDFDHAITQAYTE